MPTFTRAHGFPWAVILLVMTAAASPPSGSPGSTPNLRAVPPSDPVPASVAEQQAFMDTSARIAWSYVARNYSARAGLVRALDTYQYVTVWDIGSALASYYCAHALGYSTDAEYARQMDRALETLRTMPLYDHAAPNKFYDSETGNMVGRNVAPTAIGYGWSPIDVGRLLTWLKIISVNDTARAAAVRAVAARIDGQRLTSGGYLRGQDLDLTSNHPDNYQEGRIGYEQYAAEGFAQWNMSAAQALDFSANGVVVKVNGVTLLADKRHGDLLTADPFILMGLELGWTGAQWRPLALSMLAAQEARFKQTGIVTMVSEDAVPTPPAYFYYYLIYHEGRSFVVAAPGGKVDASYPRWVSAKAAFGFFALVPSAYTWRAVQSVRGAGSPAEGWTAGVMERSGTAVKGANLNTAAVILESALYFKRGCALVQPACATGTAGHH